MDELNECTPIGAIRAITAVSTMDIKSLCNRLAIVNLICRVLDGDTSKDFADDILKGSGIKVHWDAKK